MTQKELEVFEDKLVSFGYKRYKPNETDHETYGWYKTIYSHEPDDDGERQRLYSVHFRVWDYSPYKDRDPYLAEHPYSIDTLILDGDSGYRIDLEITSPKFDVETTEKIARDLHNMLTPYVEEAMSNQQ